MIGSSSKPNRAKAKPNAKRWSTVVASNWESTFLKSVFFRLDHHLTWDPSFHIEDDAQIYTKFAAWLFNRQLGWIKRTFKCIVIYIAVYTIAIVISAALSKEWMALGSACVGHALLIVYYYKYKKTFAEQYHLRSRTLTNAHTATSALQALSENGVSELTSFESLDYEEANLVFAKASLLPFVWLSSVVPVIDILFGGDLFLQCLPMALSIFVMTRCLLLPLAVMQHATTNKTDLGMLCVLNVGLLFEFLFGDAVTWDKWLVIFALSVFAAISMRFYGLILVHLSRKEFKRKNLMMIERYKTETLFQKVLPPQITQ
eukprot:527756_1